MSTVWSHSCSPAYSKNYFPSFSIFFLIKRISLAWVYGLTLKQVDVHQPLQFSLLFLSFQPSQSFFLKMLWNLWIWSYREASSRKDTFVSKGNTLGFAVYWCPQTVHKLYIHNFNFTFLYKFRHIVVNTKFLIIMITFLLSIFHIYRNQSKPKY